MLVVPYAYERLRCLLVPKRKILMHHTRVLLPSAVDFGTYFLDVRLEVAVGSCVFFGKLVRFSEIF